MARIARGEEVVDSAMQFIANAVTVEQLRQAQAVVLPLRFAMSLGQTAEVTGLSVGWLSKQRNRSAWRAAQTKLAHRKKRLLYSSRFWSKLARAAFWWSVKLNLTLSQALGRPISLSSVYTLLHRHDWRKLAPDKRHPQSDPIAQDEWGKTP